MSSGSETTSRMRMRPPHLRQTVTSMAKTRARRPAHARRRGLGDTSAASVDVSFAALVRPSASWSTGAGTAAGGRDDALAVGVEGYAGDLRAVAPGHTLELRSAEFSADGGRVVTASNDLTARVWDVRAGAEIAILDGHAEELWSTPPRCRRPGPGRGRCS